MALTLEQIMSFLPKPFVPPKPGSRFTGPAAPPGQQQPQPGAMQAVDEALVAFDAAKGMGQQQPQPNAMQSVDDAMAAYDAYLASMGRL